MTAVLSTPPRTDLDAITDTELLQRFVQGGDQEAFQALMRRHGPMVLGVCRRVLGNHHDAEDAFQVTFLVLANKAAALRNGELLAGWLYGVAFRTARKLRGERARRHEAALPAELPEVPLTAMPPLELAWREVQQALDEEIARLDVKYRAPLVLCYIEGKTQEQVARQLGRPAGSMSWLLGRALNEVRAGLARRGMKLLGGMPALLLALNPSVCLDPRLIDVTMKGVFFAQVGWPVARLLEAVLGGRAEQAVSPVVATLTISLAVFLLLGLLSWQGLTDGRAPVAPVAAADCGDDARDGQGGCGPGQAVP